MVAAYLLLGGGVGADSIPIEILDPNLQVTTVLNAGITAPIGIVFLDQNDFLVPEKASGQVKRVVNGVIQAAPVLDLAVNSNSERGLLSLVLHPSSPRRRGCTFDGLKAALGPTPTSSSTCRC
jgi:glucose/arabinose dehydrogenase